MAEEVATTSSGRPMRAAKQGAYESMSTYFGVGQKSADSPLDDESRASKSADDDPEFKSPRGSPSVSRLEKMAAKMNVSSTAKRPRGRPPKKPKTPVDQEINLFTLVRDSTTSYMVIADEWIESYMNDREAAVVELVQFFISACGCKGVADPQLVKEENFVQLIRRMTEDFDEESVDYPLIAAGAQAKRVRQNLCDFVKTLIKQCQYSIIYDQCMMDSIISLLTHMADSHVRAFRHTSTLCAMKIMTALAEIAVRLDQSLASVSQQLDNQRSANVQAGQRLEAIQQKKQDYSEKKDEVINMLDYLFQSIFVQRYRDTLPDIRSICVTELGNWMLTYPEHFMIDARLKYIGWTLYDKTSDVRESCLKAVLALYQDNEALSKLKLFTPKFKNRIISMVNDKDGVNGVLAIKVSMCIHKSHPNLLSPKECDDIYACVYAANRNLALAAGEFLLSDLYTPSGRKRKPDDGDAIRKLVKFHLRTKIHMHTAYLVDSLLEQMDALKNWQLMTKMLLEQGDDESLAEDEESVLIDLMACGVRQTFKGEPPAGRTFNRKYVTQKEQRLWMEEQEKMTSCFIVNLPPLLQKFVTNVNDTCNLLSIAQCFQVHLYSSEVFRNSLEELLKCLEDLFVKHSDQEVLENCSQTYEVLCNDSLPFHVRSLVTNCKIIDATVLRFRMEMEQFNEAIANADEEDAEVILPNMKRVNALYLCHDLAAWNIWDTVAPIIRPDNKYIEKFNDSMKMLALQICFMSIMWDLKNAKSNSVTEAAVVSLKKRTREYIASCRRLIGVDNWAVSEKAFGFLCDLLLMSGRYLLKDKADLKILVFYVDQALENELLDFLVKQVFSPDASDEDRNDLKQIELCRKRRSLLTAFAKLIVHGELSAKCAMEVFKRYADFYSDYGEIVKTLLNKYREMDKTACAKAMAEALWSAYLDIRNTTLPEALLDSLSPVHDLMRRFCSLLGSDLVRSREIVVVMHRCGIILARSDDMPCLNFFEILIEACNKLLPQDRKLVLNFLIESFPNVDVLDSVGGKMLKAYREALTEGGERQSEVDATLSTTSENSMSHSEVVAKKQRLDLTQSTVSSRTVSTRQCSRFETVMEVDERAESVQSDVSM